MRRLTAGRQDDKDDETETVEDTARSTRAAPPAICPANFRTRMFEVLPRCRCFAPPPPLSLSVPARWPCPSSVFSSFCRRVCAIALTRPSHPWARLRLWLWLLVTRPPPSHTVKVASAASAAGGPVDGGVAVLKPPRRSKSAMSSRCVAASSAGCLCRSLGRAPCPSLCRTR